MMMTLFQSHNFSFLKIGQFDPVENGSVPVHQRLCSISFSLVISPPCWSTCIKIVWIGSTVRWWVISERKFIGDVRTGSIWHICLDKFRSGPRRQSGHWTVLDCWLWTKSGIANIVVGGICGWTLCSIWWFYHIILVRFACLMDIWPIVVNRWAIGSAISFSTDDVFTRVFDSKLRKKSPWYGRCL